MSVYQYRENPKMFKGNPILFSLSVLMIPAGVGIAVLLVWWLKSTNTTLTIYDDKSVLKKGVLSKETNEVYHEDVKNTQISTSFLERMFNVGTLSVSSAGQGNMEIKVSGIPNPEKAKQIINKNGRESSTKSAQVSSNSESPIADELQKLADLKDQGVLTDEEFQNQKEKLLN